MENLLEHFRDMMTGATTDRGASPRVRAADALPLDSAANDDNEQLIRLLDEVTHSICRDDDDDTDSLPEYSGNGNSYDCGTGTGTGTGTGGGGGGFVVEETSYTRGGILPPLYSAAAASVTSAAAVAVGVPASASPGAVFGFAKPPPPSFAEAIASTPPLTNTARVELSPLAARYIPPMPAAQQEVLIVRNDQGVFLLQPITKPTPPYTPPSVSPPISPLPVYALPPAAVAQPQPHFLGISVALAGGGGGGGGGGNGVNGGGGGGAADVQQRQPFSASASPPSLVSGNHVMGGGSGVSGNGSVGASGARTYTFSSTAVKAGYTPPPPYPG